MAFSADELRVLRRALAHMLNPATSATPATPAPPAVPALLPGPALPVPGPALPGWARTAWAEDVQDVLRLAESIDDAVHEGGRMRAFAMAELARYRAALPGAATGYLERLEEAVADGYLPDREDLAALRNLTALPCAPQERVRRLGLRDRCGALTRAAAPHVLEPSAPQLALAAVASVAGSIAAESDNVADFARPARSLRQRDKSRTAAPATGVHAHPLPTRRGGAIPMAAFETTPKSDEPGRRTAAAVRLQGAPPPWIPWCGD